MNLKFLQVCAFYLLGLIGKNKRSMTWQLDHFFLNHNLFDYAKLIQLQYFASLSDPSVAVLFFNSPERKSRKSIVVSLVSVSESASSSDWIFWLMF